MKRLRSALFPAALVLALVLTCQPGLAQPSAAGPVARASSETPTPRLWLPIVLDRTQSHPATSFDLIDQAVANGQLGAEQGLIYKVYAEFSDARLPAQYIGTGPGRGGDAIMEEVADQAGTLSDSAKQLLTPFFVPPSDSRSWFYLEHLGGSAATASAAAGSWVPVSAAGGKVRIFYYSTNAADAAKANTLAAEFTNTIWPKLTTLMQKEPVPNGAGATDIYLWNSYLKSDGVTVVQFDRNTLGITIGSRCDQSSVNIYLPDYLPIGSANSAGLIQYATHEFMHAIQFAYTIQSCSSYRWLKEATATWAEDYVYPDADSEQETASGYLDRPAARLDDFGGLHPYGAYLLFYFLTHKVDTSAAVIRYAWENAASNAVSYEAIDKAVATAAPGWKDLYWSTYLATLWNKAPFTRYYETADGLTDTVAAAGGASIPISTPGGEQITPLNAEIPTGGALFFDLHFPDASVRDLSFLNGLGYNLHSGAASTAYSADGDETYLFDDVSSGDLQGVNVEVLLKASGQDANPMPYPLSYGPMDAEGGGLEHFDHCADAQGAFDEVVVILSNSDWAHPDRILKPAGLPVTVYANNIPCWKVTGTFTAISNPPVSNETGVKAQADGTVTFGIRSDIPLPTAYQPWWPGLFPEIDLTELSLQANWTINGTDPTGCTWNGSGTWMGTESSGGEMVIEPGLLTGGPTYRGYNALADPDSGTDNSVDTTCPNDHYTQNVSFDGLRVDLSDVADCGHIQVDAQGKLSGACTMPFSDGGYEQDTWDLQGVKK